MSKPRRFEERDGFDFANRESIGYPEIQRVRYPPAETKRRA